MAGGRGIYHLLRSKLHSQTTAHPVLSSLIAKNDQDASGMKSLGAIALLGAGVSGLLSFTTIAAADEAEHGLESPSYPWPHQGILSSYDHAPCMVRMDGSLLKTTRIRSSLMLFLRSKTRCGNNFLKDALSSKEASKDVPIQENAAASLTYNAESNENASSSVNYNAESSEVPLLTIQGPMNQEYSKVADSDKNDLHSSPFHNDDDHSANEITLQKSENTSLSLRVCDAVHAPVYTRHANLVMDGLVMMTMMTILSLLNCYLLLKS